MELIARLQLVSLEEMRQPSITALSTTRRRTAPSASAEDPLPLPTRCPPKATHFPLVGLLTLHPRTQHASNERPARHNQRATAEQDDLSHPAKDFIPAEPRRPRRLP